METEAIVTLPSPLEQPGPSELERKLPRPSSTATPLKPAPEFTPKPKKPAKQPAPEREPDLLTKLTMMEIDQYNIDDVRNLCNQIDPYVQTQGLDKFSAFIIAIVQGAIGKLLLQVTFSIDVAQNRAGFDAKADPIHHEVRLNLLPTLEKLTGLYMKVEKDRSSALHARRLGEHGSGPATKPNGTSGAR